MTEEQSQGVPRNERLRGIASMLAAVFVFAIMDASLKRLSTQYSMLQVGAMRCLASWLFVALPIAVRGDLRGLRPRSPRLHLVRGLLAVAMLASFVYAVRSLTLAETYSIFLCALAHDRSVRADARRTRATTTLGRDRLRPRRRAADSAPR
jgi:drug/metabolite transporter (DMT)-like permease